MMNDYSVQIPDVTSLRANIAALETADDSPSKPDVDKRIENLKKEIGVAIDNAWKSGFESGMKRHTWMKDGVTYVGSGCYTLKQALESAKEEGLIK